MPKVSFFPNAFRVCAKNYNKPQFSVGEEFFVMKKNLLKIGMATLLATGYCALPTQEVAAQTSSTGSGALQAVAQRQALGMLDGGCRFLLDRRNAGADSGGS
jgi:hypothetical protein